MVEEQNGSFKDLKNTKTHYVCLQGISGFYNSFIKTNVYECTNVDKV